MHRRDTVFSLLGAQQGRWDPGSPVFVLRKDEMLSRGHPHSLEQDSSPDTESQHGLSLHWPKGLQEGRSQLADRFQSWLSQSKVWPYSLVASRRL